MLNTTGEIMNTTYGELENAEKIQNQTWLDNINAAWSGARLTHQLCILRPTG